MAGTIQSITHIGEPTDMAPGTTPTPEYTGLPDESMDHTVESDMERGTTRRPAHMRVGRLHMDHTAREELHKLTTRVLVLMPRLARVLEFTEVGDPPPSDAAMTG